MKAVSVAPRARRVPHFRHIWGQPMSGIANLLVGTILIEASHPYREIIKKVTSAQNNNLAVCTNHSDLMMSPSPTVYNRFVTITGSSLFIFL